MSLLRIFQGRLALAGLVMGSACANGEEPSELYDVMVLDRIDEGSSFALQQRALETVDDLDRLSGPEFRLRRGGTLRIQSRAGDVVRSGSYTGSEPPSLHYELEEGVVVPRDEATLLMLSTAYQFERVLADLRAAVDDDTQAALDARGALSVLFEPAVVFETAALEVSVQGQPNAFFDPERWQFVIAGGSGAEHAPLAADARVIAHELGHSIFQQAFFGGRGPTCDPAAASENASQAHFAGRWDREFAIDGLNEGFTGWLSFAVTGRADPLAVLEVPLDSTFDVNVNERIRVDDHFRWSEVPKLEEPVNGSENEPHCRGEYCIGTLFMRSLVASFLASGHDPSDSDARHEFSRPLVAALAGALNTLQEMPLPLPTAEVARCEKRSEASLAYDPPIIGAFLQGFLQGVPNDAKPALCRELIERFEAGFPGEYRKACEP